MHPGPDTTTGPTDPVRPAFFTPAPVAGYELVDSGEGWKLERFGTRLLARPDPQALWRRRLDPAEWDRADMTFEREEPHGRGGNKARIPAGIPQGKRGLWRGRGKGRPGDWTIDHEGLTFVLKPTSFKHVGLFPEQATNWRWIEELGERFGGRDLPRGERPRLLNLFGYTGAASLVAHRAGFDVTHVDASRTTLGWVKENLEASGLPGDSLRLILDDAFAFAKREVRRGSRYAGVLLDPPHYGRGPKGEKWQLEEKLAGLVAAVGELLGERSFCALSTYAVGYSPLAFWNLFQDLGAPADEGVVLEAGELVLPEAGGERSLPCGFCIRWSRGLA